MVTPLCSYSLQQQGTAGVIAICGLLKLLTIVLAEPTTVFVAFVQNILDLCFGPLRQVRIGTRFPYCC